MAKVRIYLRKMPVRIKVKQDPKKKWVCGVGDGVHDVSVIAFGSTKEAAALAFVRKWNADNRLTIANND